MEQNPKVYKPLGEMYVYSKNDKSFYDIVHINKEAYQTWIASTDTAEKADFLVKAANKFKSDESNY